MKVAVGIGCLVILGLMAETTGFTVQQQLMEQQRNGIGTTKPLCLALGGNCQHKDQPCDGIMIQGKKYCEHPKIYECCVPKPPPEGCVFGFTTYSNGTYLEEACVKFQCIDGTWIFRETIPEECGMCQVDGDPHVITYDYHTNNIGYPFAYSFSGIGTYAITQPGCDVYPECGVKAEFVPCPTDSSKSCVLCVNYFELGIAVDMCLPKPKRCNSTSEPDCYITVSVGGSIVTIGSGVQQFSGTAGDVLVFEHNDGDIDSSGYNGFYCINVVGSKGLRVALCLATDSYAAIFVWAKPQLQQDSSLLYGLCDTYTWTERNNYTLRSNPCGSDAIAGKTQAEINTFADSWECPPFPKAY